MSVKHYCNCTAHSLAYTEQCSFDVIYNDEHLSLIHTNNTNKRMF